MKPTLTSILLLSLACIYAQLNDYISPYRSYENGEKVSVFGDNVNLRSAPNIQSEVLALMPIGASVTVLENTEADDKWVNIQYKQTEGYISADMLSMQTFTFNQKPLYTQMRHGNGDNDAGYYLNIRVPDAENVYREYAYPIWTTTLSLEMFGNRGLEGVDNIIHISYLSEACGVDGGGKYIFITDGVWREAINYVSISDAGVFSWYEQFLFPDEHKIPNKIKYISESHELLEDGPDYENPTYAISHKIERLLEWKNNELSPKFEQTSLLSD